jgi:hypothetical protein
VSNRNSFSISRDFKRYCFLTGAVLDPRFKLDWVTSAGIVKSDVEAKLREELKKRLAKNGIFLLLQFYRFELKISLK